MSSDADYEEVSTPKVQERIKKATQDQDQALDAIYQGAVRLKGAAIATNEEVTAQNQMIDEIAIDIDHTQHTVQNQTHVARKVTKKHRELCCYYVVIALQISALIVILVI